MIARRVSGTFIAVAAGLLALLLTADSGAARPALLGLTIGNGDYSELPALPACPASAGAVAEALRGAGFEVTERTDVTIGGLAAALGELGRQLETTSEVSVILYFCGYTAALNDRPFLLPISASLDRQTDVMTEGILAKALLDLLARGNPSRALVALDLAPVPGTTAPPLDVLTEAVAPEGTGLVAVTSALTASTPSALSEAFSAALTAPDVETGMFLASVEAALEPKSALRIAALRPPQVSLPLIPEEPPAQLVPPVRSQPRSEEIPAKVAKPLPKMPEESDMTDGERRWIQEELKRVGYYAGPIDGIFGPETRAGIRRLQFELGAEMTGTLTGEQAARLITMD